MVQLTLVPLDAVETAARDAYDVEAAHIAAEYGRLQAAADAGYDHERDARCQWMLSTMPYAEDFADQFLSELEAAAWTQIDQHPGGAVTHSRSGRCLWPRMEITVMAHGAGTQTSVLAALAAVNAYSSASPGEPGYLHIDFATFANVGDDGRPNEWPETVEYLFRLRQLLYLPIVRVDPHVWTPSLGNLGETAGLFDTYYERETMPFRAFRGCTDKFKIIPQDSFLTFLIERAAGFGVDLHIRQVIGYSADEADRAAAFTPSHPNIHPRFPLVEWGWKRRETVANFQRLAPLVAKLVGLPTKSGCWFCPFQPVGRRLHDGAPQPRTWLALEDSHPDLAALGMAMEARQNARRLAQGKKPAYLADKRRPLTYLLPRAQASTAQPTLDLDNDNAPDAPTCTSWGCFR